MSKSLHNNLQLYFILVLKVKNLGFTWVESLDNKLLGQQHTDMFLASVTDILKNTERWTQWRDGRFQREIEIQELENALSEMKMSLGGKLGSEEKRIMN